MIRNSKRALDLFCGAGGATKGLQRAGFHVTGIDLVRQRHYCGDAFIQGDCIELPVVLQQFDFVWASPPCQAWSIASAPQRKAGKIYFECIAIVREMLMSSGKAYCIENVMRAPIHRDILLCGSMFGLRVIRHRRFEISWQPTQLLPACNHPKLPITVCGNGTNSTCRKRRVELGLVPDVPIAERRAAMGIDWMNREELAQAIPPAYSEYIGRQFLGL